MQDLFGEPIELSVKRGKAEAGRVTQTAGESVATLRPEPESMDGVEELSVDLPIRQAVERHLNDLALSYVDVQKVQQCLFSANRLQTFDFAVPDGNHTWLVYAGDRSDRACDDLREWERIFGPGFTALVAEKIEDYDNDTSTLAFRTLDGEEVMLG